MSKSSREVDGSFAAQVQSWAENNQTSAGRGALNQKGLSSFKSVAAAERAVEAFQQDLKSAGLDCSSRWTAGKNELLKTVLGTTRADKKDGAKLYPVHWYARTEFADWACDGPRKGVECSELVRATYNDRARKTLRCESCQGIAQRLEQLEDRVFVAKKAAQRKAEQEAAEAAKKAAKEAAAQEKEALQSFIDQLESKLESGFDVEDVEASLSHFDVAYAKYLQDGAPGAKPEPQMELFTSDFPEVDTIASSLLEEVLDGELAVQQEMAKKTAD